MYLYAKRTDTDCFIVAEDEQGNKQYAREIAINSISRMYADPVEKVDGTEFRSAGVFVVVDENTVQIITPCSPDGGKLSIDLDGP